MLTRAHLRHKVKELDSIIWSAAKETDLKLVRETKYARIAHILLLAILNPCEFTIYLANINNSDFVGIDKVDFDVERFASWKGAKTAAKEGKAKNRRVEFIKL